MTTTAPLTAEDFVARLLAIENEQGRHSFIERHTPGPDGTAHAIRSLLDEAERLKYVDPRRMEQVCLTAMSLSEHVNDGYLWAMSRFKHGEACALQDRNAEACNHFDEARAAFLRLERPVEAARTRITWIWAMANLGGDAEVLASARKARKIFVACDEPAYRATLDLNVGILHCLRGRYLAGSRRFKSALSAYQLLGVHERTERARHNLALALSRLGRYREALAELEMVRESARQAGRTLAVAIMTRAIGETHLRLGRHAAALRAFQEAMALHDALGYHRGEIQSALDLADCYLRINRPVDSMNVLDDIDKHLDHIDSSGLEIERAYRRVAALLQMEQYQEALSILEHIADQQAIAPAEDRAWLTARRAEVLLGDGSALQSLQVAREAVAVARASNLRPLVADALLAEGRALLALRDLEPARSVAVAARRIAARQDVAPLLQRSYELLGDVAVAGGQSGAAGKLYGTAIRHFEREQRNVIFEFRDSFAAKRTDAYVRLALIQLTSGRARRAIGTVERAKSRALADLISGTIALRPRGSAAARRLIKELDSAREEYAALYSRIAEDDQTRNALEGAAAQRRLVEAENRIDDLTRRLQLSAPASEIADLYTAAPSAPTPRRPVPADTTLIEYFFAGQDVLRFTATASGVRGLVLSGVVPEVERLLRMFRLNLDATMHATEKAREHLATQARTILARLYHRLLDGVSLGSGVRSLVIVPHGLLHYVPFHALHDGDQFLVEKYAISYAPSLALYDICLGRLRRRRGKALILAHSADGRLPYARIEAERVGRALGAPVYHESEATRSLLTHQGRSASIIHIAAHGQFRPDAPLFSHIRLADGPLTTADVFNLDLRANLVTLSACETGRAVLGGGDELVGLSRAFLYAGAAGLVVSQWRVDDESTAALMTHFYRMLNARARPAEALRAAQIAVATDTRSLSGSPAHPFLWAGFQVVGAA